MKIDILDMDRAIEVNELKEVTSPILFSNKMTYDPEGILSSEIFGISKGERRSTFGYIILKMTFIHPHIYHKVFKSMFRNIIYIISGRKRFRIMNGLPVEDPDGWTGIKAFYDHYDEIDWSKSKSSNTTNKELLMKLSKDQVFVNKILVCPPAYRDVMLAGTVDSSDHVNEVNNLYQKIIRSVALLSEGGLFQRTQYATQSKIQDTLVEISEYFKNQIAHKTGLIRKYLLGKSVDYGVRTVISAAAYNNERIQDNMVGLEYAAVPIYECCVLFYPFIESWVRNFFTRELINNPNIAMYYDYEDKREISGSIKDPEIQFSDKKIRKMINAYCYNPDSRFQGINVDAVIVTPTKTINKKVGMLIKGKIILPNNIEKTLNRLMTVTDLLYLACVDVCEKRHIMVSRYPAGTDKGIYFARVRVQSTARHIRLIYNGKEYKFYPDIQLDTPKDHVATQFVDTLVTSSSHLDGMGADLTKSQSWSARMVTFYKNNLVNA